MFPASPAANAAATVMTPEEYEGLGKGEQRRVKRAVVVGAFSERHASALFAREAGTTVRNVRVYQDRGLLPPPRKEGRTGFYSQAHLARLRLIGRLLERGYTFATIGELLAAWQEGRQIEDLLGLEEVVTEPWSSEEPGKITLTELRKAFGKQAGPAALSRATQLGLIQRAGRAYTVPSPKLLGAGIDLVRAGVPLVVVLDLAEALRTDLSVVAHRFVSIIEERVLPAGGELPSSEEVHDLAEVIRTLRPLAIQVVESVFAAAMETEVSSGLSRTLSRSTTSGASVRPSRTRTRDR